MLKYFLTYSTLLLTYIGLNAQTIEVSVNLSSPYVELSSGTSINNGATWDDGQTLIPLDFDFPFASQTFNSLKVDYNGSLIFGSVDPYNTSIGDTVHIIQGYNADLISRTVNGSISDVSYFKNADSLIVQFKNAGFYSNASGNSYMNFQITIYSDGRFNYNYGISLLEGDEFGSNTGPEIGAGSSVYFDDGLNSGFNTYQGTYLTARITTLLNKKAEFNSWVIESPPANSVLLWGKQTNTTPSGNLQYIFAPTREILSLNGTSDLATGIISLDTEIGNLTGINQFRDKAIAEKYYINDSAKVQGLLFQADGIVNPDIDGEVIFKLTSGTLGGLPEQVLTGTAIDINSLKYNGEISKIVFDSSVVLSGVMFLVVELPEYNEDISFGTFVSTVTRKSSVDPIGISGTRNLIQLFNDEWIGTNSRQFASRLSANTSEQSDFFTTVNLYYAMSPVFSNLGDSTLLQSNLTKASRLVSTRELYNSNDLLVYPTQATDVVSVSYRQLDQMSYSIHNSEGIVTQNGTLTENDKIDVSGLVKGIYFISFITKDQSIITKKIYKQ